MVKFLQNIGLVEDQEYSVSLYVERLQRDEYKELQNHQKGTQNEINILQIQRHACGPLQFY